MTKGQNYVFVKIPQLGVVIAPRDKLFGQTSRIDLATAWVKCLSIPETKNKAFAIINQGKRPEAIAFRGASRTALRIPSVSPGPNS